MTTGGPPTGKHEMRMQEVVDAYLDEHEAGTLYAKDMRRQCRKLAAYGVSHVADLTATSVNGWLASLTLSQVSRANARRLICTLWRFCHERGWTDEFPGRVRRIRCRPSPPTAWSKMAIEDLVKRACEDQRPISKRLPNIRYCDVIPAWICLGWDSGLRFGDIHLLRGQHLRNGCVCVTAQKTGKATVRKISQGTLGLCESLLAMSPDGTLFRWAIPRRRAFVMWRNFLTANNFSGTSKWLRRSSGTAVEKLERGGAREFLGHDDESTTKTYYLDQTLLQYVPTGPEPLALPLNAVRPIAG